MKNVVLIVCGVVLMLISNEAIAQSSRDSETSSITKSSTTFSKKKKGSKKVFGKNHDQGLKDFEKLMKENKKKYHKMQKGMQKPQYSDPSYFGHKKPPKKRAKGKRKFCKECGITH